MTLSGVQGEIASRWRRISAFLLDGLFIGMFQWFVPPDAELIAQGVAVAYVLVSNAAGVSPAKYYLRILIRTRDSSRPGVFRGAVRSVETLIPFVLAASGAHLAAAVVFGVRLLGYFPILTHSERRSVYDQLAGTWVVRGRRQRTGTVIA